MGAHWVPTPYVTAWPPCSVIPDDRNVAEVVAVAGDLAERRERQVGRHQQFAGLRRILEQFVAGLASLLGIVLEAVALLIAAEK